MSFGGFVSSTPFPSEQSVCAAALVTMALSTTINTHANPFPPRKIFASRPRVPMRFTPPPVCQPETYTKKPRPQTATNDRECVSFEFLCELCAGFSAPSAVKGFSTAGKSRHFNRRARGGSRGVRREIQIEPHAEDRNAIRAAIYIFMISDARG